MDSDTPDFVKNLEQLVVEEPNIEKARGEIRKLSEIQNYGDDDPNCLLGNRYLSREGGLLFVAPTGTGKSTAIMQMALLWAVGKPAFGIMPKHKIKTLIIQAENDDGDLAEMRDGVLFGMTRSDIITRDEAYEASDSVCVVRDVTNTADMVGPQMDARIVASGCDMVVLDPIFSYLGGETNSAKDVGHFLRNVINPVLLRRKVGFIAVHHSNKPLQGQQKADWQAGDFAYLGAGSAEFANWARAVLAIRSMGNHDVFQMVAAKRGKRIGWVDEEDGTHQTSRFIKHGSEGLCWLDASKSDVEQAKNPAGSRREALIEIDIEEVINLACSKIWKLNTLKEAIKEEYGITSGRSNRLDDALKLVKESPRVKLARYYEDGVPVYIIGSKKDVANHLQNEGKS
jgi:transposase